MQVMTWPLARMGGRFGLLLEPERRRVMHSALGRFFDQPLELSVGLVEPDGTERVLPFTPTGTLLHAPEQFERINSITYRAHSETSGLRFEFNLHSPFYPQNESLSLLPAIYVELRVTWADEIRRRRFYERLYSVRLFLRLKRPDTAIQSSPGRIDLAYRVPLEPRHESACGGGGGADSDVGMESAEPGAPVATPGVAHVVERIVSLNDGAEPVVGADGSVGLAMTLPVTEEGSGIKWRLVWAAHTSDPVLTVRGRPARLRYLRYWDKLDTVVTVASTERDDRLILSRRFEKLIEQAPLDRSRWHLLTLAFQSYLSNTFWCDQEGGGEFFSVWEGSQMYHNTLDVGYNLSAFYLALWPSLLGQCLRQWAGHSADHPDSQGVILHHDMGRGCVVDAPAYRELMPVEENSNFLLMLQAYTRWTGDLGAMRDLADTVRRSARHLVWSDREQCGFPTEGTANTLADGNAAIHSASRQTYLAVKRVAALLAAADLLELLGDRPAAESAAAVAADAVTKIEAVAWLDDHYAVCAQPAPGDGLGDTILLAEKGWDSYSIHTANALLLPAMIGRPDPFNRHRMAADLAAAHRETLGNYGCGHTSSTPNHVWISQNLWRDAVARYLHVTVPELDERYWDLLVFSNSAGQSLGYSDTYIFNELVFNPRGAAAFAAFIAGPRLVVDRLDGATISVDPDRHRPQRWPLLPLADWRTGKIPICVVDAEGAVRMEGGGAGITVVDRSARLA